jgi:cAMP phosphodiesterase
MDDMKICLLPSHVLDPAHLQPLTTFLINGTFALDGGSLGFALELKDQIRVRAILVTHAHADHIATLPVFIAEVFPFLEEPIRLYSTDGILDALRKYVFNDIIWPDFQRIRPGNSLAAGLELVRVESRIPFEAENLRITLVPVNHSVPTVGAIIEDDGAAVAFTSDTYHTDEIWQIAHRVDRLKAVFVDVSYPDEMENLAAAAGHLTPHALELELAKLNRDVRVFATHLKPQLRARVLEQLAKMRRSGVEACEIGRDYYF